MLIAFLLCFFFRWKSSWALCEDHLVVENIDGAQKKKLLLKQWNASKSLFFCTIIKNDEQFLYTFIIVVFMSVVYL